MEIRELHDHQLHLQPLPKRDRQGSLKWSIFAKHSLSYIKYKATYSHMHHYTRDYAWAYDEVTQNTIDLIKKRYMKLSTETNDSTTTHWQRKLDRKEIDSFYMQNCKVANIYINENEILGLFLWNMHANLCKCVTRLGNQVFMEILK